MRIDAHQHFWDLGRFAYAWMPPEPSPLRHNYLPQQLGTILKRNRFDGCVAVQATTAIEETHWLLELAAEHDFIFGVVGWVDLTDPRLGETLDQLQPHFRFKGVRHPAHDEPDSEWLLREEVIGGLKELERRDLPYDLLVRPPHLPVVRRLIDRVPSLRMVIDHIAKPRIAERDFEGWAPDLERLAKHPSLHVKLSGMITEAARDGWRTRDIEPYLQHALRVFGPDRSMFGSDWPVCLLAAPNWKGALSAFTQALGAQTEEVRDSVLGGTAKRFYRL
jgi:L-fucono-1,5-lactonase